MTILLLFTKRSCAGFVGLYSNGCSLERECSDLRVDSEYTYLIFHPPKIGFKSLRKRGIGGFEGKYGLRTVEKGAIGR